MLGAVALAYLAAGLWTWRGALPRLASMLWAALHVLGYGLYRVGRVTMWAGVVLALALSWPVALIIGAGRSADAP